jgi:predicted RND superfamily exporter protein
MTNLLLPAAGFLLLLLLQVVDIPKEFGIVSSLSIVVLFFLCLIVILYIIVINGVPKANRTS